VLVYVKDEGNNLNTFENVFSTTIRCKLLELKKFFANICSNHVMNKMCQYAITKVVCASMKNFYQKSPSSLAKNHNLDKEKWERALKVG
jgi:hypothetical protein